MTQLKQVAILLRGYEEQLLDPFVRRDTAAVAALLDDDFREFGSSGRFYTKAQIFLELVAEPPSNITLSHFICRHPAPGVALVTYRSTRQPSGVAANRSSLWVLREDRWQMLFHQGTRIPEPG